MLNIIDLKTLCKKYRFTPDKKFGQNYLLSDKPIKKMISAIKLTKNDTVVEVGPGFGALTEELSKSAGSVVAFEIERKLTAYWEEKLSDFSNVEIIWGDFLRNFDKLPQGKYKVAANLPYQITSKILRTFLELSNPPEIMVFLVQKEVGERICALDGKSSLLSLSIAYYALPKMEMVVSRNDFFPVPGVDSAVLSLKIKKNKPEIEAKEFFRAIRAGFSSPRKMLIKNLTAIYEKDRIKAAFSELNIDEKIRPEDLKMEEWIKFIKFIKLSSS